MRRPAQILIAASFATILAGCYSPDGGLAPSTGRGWTYISTPMTPYSISVVDTRTQEAFFAMDVPPGKQLTFNIIEGGGDDPVYTPNRLVYSVFEPGTQIGTLDNQLTAPPMSCVRIDVSIRQTPEWPEQNPEVRLRTDQLADRPPYFTPAGGALPSANDRHVYDR